MEEKTSKADRVAEKLWSKLNQIHHCNTRNIVGKVLTVIDGCIVDKEQKEAVKNLIQEAVYTTSNRFVDHMVKQCGILASYLKEDWKLNRNVCFEDWGNFLEEEISRKPTV